MSGKKGKKTKGKTITLQVFLGDTPPAAPAPAKSSSNWNSSSNWADDEEDDYGGYTSRPKEPIVLPTAPRSARDASINEENIPTQPPFVAYISNLPYDIDDDDMLDFFKDMNVANMRLPKETNMMKGFGYVEFEDRQSLIDALSMPDTHLKSRRLRIEVSSRNNDERRGRMGRMGDGHRDYSEDPERTMGDWRSARAAPADDGGDEDRDRGYRSRGGFERGGGRDNGFENMKPGAWRSAPRELPDRDSRPPPSYRDRASIGDSERGERDWNRFADRGRGIMESRDRDGDRTGDRGGFGSRRHYDDIEKEKERWVNLRSAPREPLPLRESREPRDSDRETESAAPATRPKLALQPRTKPVEQAAASADAPGTEDVVAAAPNIFGSAKPVDTASKEREIEERLAKSAEARSKEDIEKRSAPPKEGAWSRRNGEGRDENQERSRPAWRSADDRQPKSDPHDSGDSRDPRDRTESRNDRSGSRGPPNSRNARPSSRGPPKTDDVRTLEERERDELARMPKAKENTSPNFIASNKYSMLPDDVDPDNIDNIEE
ncbi:eukaryotic translation initiation factor 4B-like [Phymastichus coffea]|uniref:eukaryotic translation initiation factor 4B-like n=1 Tax=Phymastichus coffea TaxID=108790 RepID=UPI00273B6F3D|nr:eukaryotic translation initiation factor 4B-like [Phymastichus coffea]